MRTWREGVMGMCVCVSHKRHPSLPHTRTYVCTHTQVCMHTWCEMSMCLWACVPVSVSVSVCVHYTVLLSFNVYFFTGLYHCLNRDREGSLCLLRLAVLRLAGPRDSTACVWHDSSICVWHNCRDSEGLQCVLILSGHHDSFTCVTRLLHMYDAVKRTARFHNTN